MSKIKERVIEAIKNVQKNEKRKRKRPKKKIDFDKKLQYAKQLELF